MTPTAAVEELGEKSGKYLIFLLGKEEFGVSVSNVREIIPHQEIAATPQDPPYVRGVINLRGVAMAVVDARKRFGLGHIEDTERTSIIVVDVDRGGSRQRFGLLVDGVAEVQRIGVDDIQTPPGFHYPWREHSFAVLDKDGLLQP